mmetsp:Transcript_2924/g.5862  ORF Transcript_2924/g.5862 Transcript_2924/m.5862 type:complete len:86 (-) Transcript_2924:433-690(-)
MRSFRFVFEVMRPILRHMDMKTFKQNSASLSWCKTWKREFTSTENRFRDRIKVVIKPFYDRSINSKYKNHANSIKQNVSNTYCFK